MYIKKDEKVQYNIQTKSQVIILDYLTLLIMKGN